jgi:hypothetical protein
MSIAPVSPVVEVFDTILSLVYAPALVVLLVLGVYYGVYVVDLTRITNSQSGQLLLELLVGAVILALSIAFAVSILT